MRKHPVYFTDSEHAILSAAAARRGVSVRELLVSAASREIDRVQDNPAQIVLFGPDGAQIPLFQAAAEILAATRRTRVDSAPPPLFSKPELCATCAAGQCAFGCYAAGCVCACAGAPTLQEPGADAAA